MKKYLRRQTKEWMQLRRDKLLLVLGLLMPVVLLFLYDSSPSLQLRNVRLAVYDYDITPLSREYIATYANAITFRLVAHEPDESTEETLASGKAVAALVIPRNFERDVRRGNNPIVQLLIDDTDANAATVLGNMAKSLNSSFQSRTGLVYSGATLVSLQQRLWFNPGLSNPVYFGTGSLGMVLALFPALLRALAIAREYELGNVIQAYASSLTGYPVDTR
jgi:ABC-2 type transport system permease protein